MKFTENLNLALYEGTDKMSVTAEENSLNANMKIIDEKISESGKDIALIHGKDSEQDSRLTALENRPSGAGTVKSVNGNLPDENGNVEVTAEVDPTQVDSSVKRYLETHPVLPYDDTEIREEIGVIREDVDKATITGDIVVFNGFDDPYLTIKDGYAVDTNGSETTNESFNCTDFIPVKPGDKIIYNVFAWTYIGIIVAYDESKRRVDAVEGIKDYKSGEYAVGSGTAYIRLSYNKTKLGNAVRLERNGVIPTKEAFDLVRNTVDSVSNVKEENVILNGWHDALVIKGSYIDNTGNAIVNPTFQYTDFIPVSEGDRIRYNLYGYSDTIYIVTMYNAEKVRVGGIVGMTGYKKGVYSVVNGVAYVRICSSSYELGDFFIEQSVRYTPIVEKVLTNQKYLYAQSPMHGKIWACLGDSITFGVGTTKPYHKIIAERVGCNATNYGVPNTAISKRGNQTNDMWTRYTEMRDDADIITVFGGTNDHGNHIPIGQWGDATETTLYGAMTILCNGLTAKYLGKKIAFFTPLPKYTGTSAGVYTDYSYPNAEFMPYIECIKDVCARFSIPCLDLYTGSGLSVSIEAVRNSMIPDGLHPNEAGHEMISWKIQRFLERL